MTFEVLKVATIVGLLAPRALAVPSHCLVKVDPGPCRAAMPRWAFNETTNACARFTFGGCKPNGNNFGSKVLCEKSCVMVPRAGAESSENVCEQNPKERGECKAAMKRWSYDSDAKKCVRFIFGGCKGNANNFGSFKKCKKTCGGLRVNLKFAGNVKRGQKTNALWQVHCNLPAEQGPGRARLDRYFYDGKTNECKPFAYGGFLGNKNNFMTQQDCLDTCHGRGKKFRRKMKKRRKSGKKSKGGAAKAAAKAASSEKPADTSRGNKDKTSGLAKVDSKPKAGSGGKGGDAKRVGLGGGLLSQRDELMFNFVRG